MPASLRHRVRAGFLLPLASLLAVGVAAGQSPQAATLQRIDSMAAAEFARDSIASLTLGVVTAQGLVWTKSYGFADMATRRVAERGSVYRIGSITKMFTALMLQQLAADGKVRLSDPVERFYPEIREIQWYSRASGPISLVQLATMTAGIAREPKQEGPFWTGPVSRWDSTLHSALSHTELELAPGTRFMYSNIGYAILGATLSRAAGVPFVQWQKERILTPLGMQHTAFEVEPSIASSLTRGYDISESGTPDASQADREAREGRGFKVPNGALFTTIDDLSRFLTLQLGQGPPGVVPPARLDSAYRGVVDASGKPTAQYGIGFSVEQHDGATVFGHNGGVAGYTAFMYFDRERQIGIIVLRNATGGRVRAGRLAVNALQTLMAP